MSFIQTALTRFVTEQDAVSSTEYALLAVLIGVASTVVLALLSANVHQLYAEICAAVTSAVSRKCAVLRALSQGEGLDIDKCRI
jgi:Flp pilus assembly pilin Flp